VLFKAAGPTFQAILRERHHARVVRETRNGDSESSLLVAPVDWGNSRCIHFIMAATGILLSFERQMVEFADRDLRSVSVPSDSEPRPMNKLLDVVRRSGVGAPSGIVIRNQRQATTQFSIGRNKTVFVDPYCGAILGVSSTRAHEFFFAVERLHRSLGAPLGSKSVGHWLAAISNLLFGALIVLGLVLWLPRKWSWNAVRASVAFRAGLRGRAREWNWHNVLGIWCALPLLVITLSGVVMSFEWANALLFQLSGSALPAGARGGERHPQFRQSRSGIEPNYEHLFMVAKQLNPDWRTITLGIAADPNTAVSAMIDAGAGGQPQKRTQYLLNRDTGAVVKATTFKSGSLGQRLRAFVRFGHTGEYYGLLGQVVAAIASFGVCVLVYTGLSLSIRRLAAKLKRKGGNLLSGKVIETSECAENT